MIQMLAENITAFLVSSNIIESEKKEIYGYGFEIMISTLVGFLTILIVGGIYGEFYLGIFYLLMIVPVRMLCGGYHADTYWLCNTVFGLVFFLVLTCYSYIATSNFIWITIPANMLSLLIVSIYAPIENIHKPLNKAEKKKFKKLSMIVFLILTVISLLLSSMGAKLGIFISTTLTAIALLIIAGKISGGNVYDENKKYENNE